MGQTVRRGEVLPQRAIVAAHTNSRAQPDVPVAVLKHGPDHIVGQSL